MTKFKPQFGSNLAERREYSSYILEKFFPWMMEAACALADFENCDAGSLGYIGKSGRMASDFSVEENIVATAYGLIFKEIMADLGDDKTPDLTDMCEYVAVKNRLGLRSGIKFPEIPELDDGDFLAAISESAIDIAHKPEFGWHSFALAWLWLNVALCANGLQPFCLPRGKADEFLAATSTVSSMQKYMKEIAATQPDMCVR